MLSGCLWFRAAMSHIAAATVISSRARPQGHRPRNLPETVMVHLHSRPGQMVALARDGRETHTALPVEVLVPGSPCVCWITCAAWRAAATGTSSSQQVASSRAQGSSDAVSLSCVKGLSEMTTERHDVLHRAVAERSFVLKCWTP